MKIFSKLLILTLIAAMCFSLVACAANGAVSRAVNEEIETDNIPFTEANKYVPTAQNVGMESETDSFSLLETTYGADESFVYTAIVSFERGVAAALAFGAEDGSHYWVFNVDREANRVKLLYQRVCA